MAVSQHKLHMKNGCLIAFFSVLGAFFLLFLIGIIAVMGGGAAVDFNPAPVVVVKLEGPIFDVDDILKELHDYRDSKDVKAVVLRINSPGGAVAPSQDVYLEVLKLKESGKKVIVSMGTVAASGGYYIASAADKIVANTGTITGSIGVIMESFGLQNVMQTLQVQPRTIKSGKFKDAGNPFREMNDEERAYLQSLSDNMYQIFVNDVAKARKMDVAKVEELAQGRIYTGSQAKELGLVDSLGNIYDAIDLAKAEAGLPADAAVKWPKEPSPFEVFLGEKAMLHYANKILLQVELQNWPRWSL